MDPESLLMMSKLGDTRKQATEGISPAASARAYADSRELSAGLAEDALTLGDLEIGLRAVGPRFFAVEDVLAEVVVIVDLAVAAREEHREHGADDVRSFSRPRH